MYFPFTKAEGGVQKFLEKHTNIGKSINIYKHVEFLMQIYRNISKI